MEPFDSIRFFAICLQIVGPVVAAFSLSLLRAEPVLGGALVIIGVSAWFAGRRILRWAVDSDPTSAPGGPFDSAASAAEEPVAKQDLVGREGKVVSPLRPFGSVEIGAELVEVVSEHEYIPVGGTVKIIARRGKQLIARPINRPQSL